MNQQIKKKSKLELEYDEVNGPNKTLEEEEGEIVQNYEMKEGDYKIIITIYEASDLIPRPADYFVTQLDKSACDAFVEIQIRDQKKKTPVRSQTNNPIWQEPFYFHFEQLSIQDLDRLKITFNVYDKNHFIIADSILGQFELDWTNIYFRRYHQIYRGWLTLSDPNEENKGPVGYLLVNIAVLGPEDKIMVHDSAYIKDPLTTIEDTITNTKTPLIDYSIIVEVYRAENLIPLDLASRSVDAYVVAKFCGNKVRSSIVASLNPEWNEALKIGTGIPNKTKYLILEVWNRNRLSGDDLIGVIKIPFVDINEEKFVTAQWRHLYGPPMCAKDQDPINFATKMQVYGEEIGSHYRGRIMFKVIGKKYVYTKTSMNKLQFKFPFKPTPVVPLKTYTLSVELIEGFQLPDRPEAYLQIAIGQYLIKTKLYQVKQRLCTFMDILQDKKLQFPEDLSQVPDIIIYFCDGKEEKNRMSFIRVKANSVATKTRHKNAEIYQLQGDKSLNLLKSEEVGGYITCSLNLYTDAVPIHRTIQNDYKQYYNYTLMFYLYKGENFPPANVQGDCDPFIRFNYQVQKEAGNQRFIVGQSRDSKEMQGSFNPFWQQIIQVKVNFQDIFTTNITKGVVCEAFDFEDSGKHQYIGSFLLKLNSELLKFKKGENGYQYLYQKPKWYFVKNPHVELGKNIFGKVLLSFALFKQEDITSKKIPLQFITQVEKMEGEKNQSALIPKQEKNLQIYLIGLRDIRNAEKKMITQEKVQVKIRLDSFTFESKQLQLRRNGCEINQLIEQKVRIPKNKLITPFLDFKIMNIKTNTFYGYNSISLYSILPKMKDKDGAKHAEEDSQKTIVDVEGLEAQLVILREKKKMDKLKVALGGASDNKYVEELAPPMELAIFKSDEIEENKMQFDNLLKVFEGNFATDPDYNYVRELEKNRDLAQQNERKLVKRSNDLQSSSSGKLDEEDHQIEEEHNLLPQQRINPQMNPPKYIRQIRKTRQETIKIQTVFDKMRKVKQEKTTSQFLQPNGLPIKSDLKSIRQQSRESVNQQPSKYSERHSRLSEREKRMGEHQLSSRLEMKKNIAEVNSEKQLKIHHLEASKRYTLDVNRSTRSLKSHKSHRSERNSQYMGAISEQPFEEEDQIEIEIKTDQQFSDKSVEERAIRYRDVERVMKQEEKDELEAREKDEAYKFGNAVKLTLFGWNRKKKKGDIETYDDFDTEQGEDLNIIPEWYKGRKILTSDFEDLNFKSSKVHAIPLYGGQRIQNSVFHTKKKETAGHLKMIIMSESSEVAEEKSEYYTKLLKPKEYYCRIYILKGKSLISGFDVKPSTYLRITYADEVVNFKDKTFKQNEPNPEYYVLHELPLNLPGPCVVKIEVMQTHQLFGKYAEKVLGFTQIDIEQRYFIRKWHLYEKKPIELRNLYSEYGIGSQGRLETFIELIEKKKWLNTPAHKIEPPPFIAYELRVIIYKTDDCVFKNIEMESNDIFVRATVGTHEFQETDTHWACRAIGNFNYRMKFPVNYPPKPQDMYSDVFTVQIWDRDIVGYNNLIGQARINLNKIHRIIQKAVKRKKKVQGRMKIKEKNFMITDRFWFDVTNNREKDEFGMLQPQGRVQMSFELVPEEDAKKEFENGFGRSEPNVYPTLSDPEGRLQFDFLNPLSFIKQIVGPKLFAKWCCRVLICLLLVLLGLFGFIFLPTLLAVKI